MSGCAYYADWNGFPDGYYTDPPTMGGVPCNPSVNGGGVGSLPNNVGNLGGWPAGSQGQLSQILNSILSGVALIQGANYVPTPLQSGQIPQGASGQQNYIPFQYPIGYNQGGYGGGGNAAGAFQRYIEQHPMVVAAIAIGGVLLLLPRPIQSRRNGLRKVRRIKRGRK